MSAKTNDAVVAPSRDQRKNSHYIYVQKIMRDFSAMTDFFSVQKLAKYRRRDGRAPMKIFAKSGRYNKTNKINRV